MKKLFLFSDGSVSTQTKIGFGAYFICAGNDWGKNDFRPEIKTKQFMDTSSTKLELQTLLWALSEIESGHKMLTIYTDSQNIVTLLERRERLEKSNFCSKKGVELSNSELYKQFFTEMDSINCEVIKVEGHQPSRNKSKIERFFTLVDRASRQALREWNNSVTR